MVKLILVLGDQLSPGLSALGNADKLTDVVVMAEVMGEAEYVPHHPKKIAFTFAAMRKFSERLRKDGWTVAYTHLDDAQNSQSIVGELLRRAAEFGAGDVIATEPGEWRLITALGAAPLPVQILPDDRFITSHAQFFTWAEGRKELRMEWFYRDMRRKTGLLMEGDKPAGGKWNFDHDNRKGPPKSFAFYGPIAFEPDAQVTAVLDLVEAKFGNNFGDLRPFWYATDAQQAEQQLDHWITNGLPSFGTYQDAMIEGEAFLSHSLISFYINAGLLDPLDVCRRVEQAWKDGFAPINAAEGYIRQIIGWREYMRGIYFREGPEYTARNVLGHRRDLPAMYWGEATQMNCVGQAVAQTKTEAYAHHIQRLMVTGNFALLAGIDPSQVHEWYLAVYADAYEWVEAPNVIGMSQFADGGIVGSKPYISSGNYIAKMSNYCKGCAYDVKVKEGEGACPFNLLYWHFLDQHRDRFAQNPRMGQMYRVWDKMDEAKRTRVLQQADAWLARMDAGEPV